MLLDGFIEIANIYSILMILLGVSIGIFVGSLPGISATLAISLLLPFSFGLTPLISVSLLISVYIGAIFGGSIAAILLNIPGTPAAAATMIDGYPLANKGEAGKALSLAALSSFFGGLIGAIILISFSPILADFALKFSAPEFFALAIFGLTIISSVSGKSLIKGFLSASLGLLIATVGLDSINAFPRFTFDNISFRSGFELVPVLIGLFGVSEVLLYLENNKSDQKTKRTVKKTRINFKEFKSVINTIIRSSFIGTFIGAVPGTGGDIAAFTSYNEAKRWSKQPEDFGKGKLQGVAAAETGNSAVTSGSMIPLLTLGIPGDAAVAVLLGGFLIHGIQPGPNLIQDEPELISGLFAAMILANIFMLIISLIFIPYFSKIIGINMNFLMPIILVLTGIGAYAINNTMVDVFVMFLFGIIGFFMSKLDIPASPIVLAVILGPMAEENFRRALIQNGGNFSFLYDRPITIILLTIAIITLSTSILSVFRKNKKNG